MAEQDYFKNALSNFTFEAASGGAIRHLADRGYTVDQIVRELSFPPPYERVQKTVWEHLLDQGTVLLAEPGNTRREKASYVIDYDRYGRKSFRRVVEKASQERNISWKEKQFCPERDGELSHFLKMQCAENGEESSYISCDFGLLGRRAPAAYEEVLQVLDEGQRAYIRGIPWERRLCFHRLDRRMQSIIVKLYENQVYGGTCYFLKSEEKIWIDRKEA